MLNCFQEKGSGALLFSGDGNCFKGGGGGGGGGGGHPDFFVKLDFEIAVEQQTRGRDRTFERVSDSGCPPVPAGQPHPYLVICSPNFAKSP